MTTCLYVNFKVRFSKNFTDVVSHGSSRVQLSPPTHVMSSQGITLTSSCPSDPVSIVSSTWWTNVMFSAVSK